MAEPRGEMPPSNALRRDEDTLRIQAVIALQVGSPAIFGLEPLGAGTTTMRTTTDMVEITPLD